MGFFLATTPIKTGYSNGGFEVKHGSLIFNTVSMNKHKFNGGFGIKSEFMDASFKG